MQEMCSRLAGHLEPAGVDDVARCVGMIQAQYPGSQSSPEAAQAAMAGYLLSLEGCPLFALQEAVKRVLRRQAPGINPKFMPAAPELRGLVDSISLNARWHLKRLERLLSAEVEREITDAERERVAALFATVAPQKMKGAA